MILSNSKGINNTWKPRKSQNRVSTRLIANRCYDPVCSSPGDPHRGPSSLCPIKVPRGRTPRFTSPSTADSICPSPVSRTYGASRSPRVDPRPPPFDLCQLGVLSFSFATSLSLLPLFMTKTGIWCIRTECTCSLVHRGWFLTNKSCRFGCLSLVLPFLASN